MATTQAEGASQTSGQSSGAPVLIAGAGLTGATLARVLAEAGLRVEVFETRDHVAGNCHTARDPETGVMVHHHGPHIFHTDDDRIWAFATRFARFRPYHHRVHTRLGGAVYPLPLTLQTLAQFFGRGFSPNEARAFLAGQALPIAAPANFEEQALALMGPALYEAFFQGYTRKQWGRDPRDLPASLLKRLPLRFSYDSRYFHHSRQAIPEAGYTAWIAAMLDHPQITLHLSQGLAPEDPRPRAHLFWTGPLDAYFGHRFGRLGYRTLDFEHRRHSGDFQGTPVMNFADLGVPYTRITEHKHFAPWEEHADTLISYETPRACGPGDLPYYPIRLAQEKSMLARYEAAAAELGDVTFAGRLGSYRYLDMDVCIREALDLAQAYLARQPQGAERHSLRKPA